MRASLCRSVLIVALLGLLAPGCSKSNEVVINGSILNAGQPIVSKNPPPYNKLTVSLWKFEDGKDEAGNDPRSSEVDAKGNFSLKGLTGHGIEPGRYLVTLADGTYDNPYKSDDGNIVLDKANSKIIVEVKSGVPVTIDISKETAGFRSVIGPLK